MITSRIITFFLSCFVTLTLSATTTSPPSTTYQSIRALDENGQSIQLQHASKAALNHGNFVMAVKHVNNTIHIISIEQSFRHQRQRPLDLVHTITPNTFLVCSGVQADTRWLVETLRSMHKQMKLRYGSTGSDWALRLASLYRAVFWGIPDENMKWQHPRLINLERWGRPLGVQSIIIDDNNLFALEPSGVIISSSESNDGVVAIGKHSSEILHQWNLLPRDDREKDFSLVKSLKAACDGILLRGTTLSVLQLATNDSWQLQL